MDGVDEVQDAEKDVKIMIFTNDSSDDDNGGPRRISSGSVQQSVLASFLDNMKEEKAKGGEKGKEDDALDSGDGDSIVTSSRLSWKAAASSSPPAVSRSFPRTEYVAPGNTPSFPSKKRRYPERTKQVQYED